MSAVAVDHATIAIGGNAILTDVSFAIADGEFVGVLGPNGAGKTTLMRAILGLLPLQSGGMSVLGNSVSRGHAGIGYLPQTRAAPPALRLTAREFLAASSRGNRWGLPLVRAADRREIDRAIDLVDARALADRPLITLSGGERQRMLLAQALIGQPRLLLLDEPLISLDPRQQQAVVALVRRLTDELALTVLFTAHELNQVLPAVDRVLYLGNGQAALGTVDEIVTPAVMSRLYGTDIDVVRVNGRIFVLADGHDVEHRPHEHDHAHEHSHHQADDAHVRL
jgi:zinc/manganese transport system ATP-binding protein